MAHVTAVADPYPRGPGRNRPMSIATLSRQVCRDLVGAALLAPSSHNTQPWRFRIAEDRIDLLADRARALPENDPQDRELRISCGCALASLRVAAAALGMAVRVQVLPDAARPDLLAAVGLDQGAVPDRDLIPLADCLPRRRTTRGALHPVTEVQSAAAPLQSAVRKEGCWLWEVADDAARRQVAELVAEGDRRQWSRPAWRRELAAWMRGPGGGDGLTVPGPLRPITRWIVRHFDLGRSVARKDAALATAAPLLFVLGTDGDGPRDHLAAGQALQRMLLVACGLGLHAGYLNQPVQEQGLRSRLQALAGHAGHPQLLLRLGRPDRQLRPTPRRTLAGVLA